MVLAPIPIAVFGAVPELMSYSALIAGAGCFSLGGFVLVRERGSLEAFAFFSFALVAAIWLMTFSSVYVAAAPADALARTRLAYLAVPLIAPAAFLFSRVMVRTLEDEARVVIVTWLLGLAFVGVALGTDLLLVDVARFDWGYYPVYGPAGIPFLLFFGGVLGKILWDMGSAWAAEAPGLRRSRLAWLTIAFAAAFTGAVDFLPKYGIDVLPLGFASLLLFLLLGSWTVFRYPLVDVSSRYTGDQILETMSDPLLVCDREGRLRRVNGAVTRLLGWEPTALEGHSLSLLDPPGASGETSLVAALHRPHPPYREIRVATAGGDTIDVSVASERIRTPGGRWVGTVVILRDIRHRKELEDRLHQAQKMEAIGRLAAGVAHDFNNILTIIRGHVQILQLDTPGDSPLSRDLAEIDRASVRAQELTGQLLQFGRAQARHPQVLDPARVIREMLSLLGRSLGPEIELAVKASDQVGRVEVDPVHLEQIVMNLVVNARDAMPGGGSLEVSLDRVRVRPDDVDPREAAVDAAAQPGDYAVLTVSDTGSGMDEEVQSRIFEPFYTTKEMGKGTGLGLATVYGIVKQNGGHIEVRSRPGQGTQFTIWLRRVAPDEGEDDQAGAKLAEAGAGG